MIIQHATSGCCGLDQCWSCVGLQGFAGRQAWCGSAGKPSMVQLPGLLIRNFRGCNSTATTEMQGFVSRSLSATCFFVLPAQSPPWGGTGNGAFEAEGALSQGAQVVRVAHQEPPGGRAERRRGTRPQSGVGLGCRAPEGLQPPSAPRHLHAPSMVIGALPQISSMVFHSGEMLHWRLPASLNPVRPRQNRSWRHRLFVSYLP